VAIQLAPGAILVAISTTRVTTINSTTKSIYFNFRCLDEEPTTWKFEWKWTISWFEQPLQKETTNKFPSKRCPTKSYLNSKDHSWLN